MASQRKLDCLMLVSSHAIHATLVAPFVAVEWEQVVDSSFGLSSVNAIASDDDSLFVAVGSSGKIAYSLDSAFAWTQTLNPFSGSNIYAVAYGNGIFIAGGSSGKLATSTDGITWVQRASSFGAGAILGIAYSSAASTWVAVGSSGKLATSLDGIDWIQRPSSFGASFITSVSASPDLLIATGYDGKIATSPNGTTWTQRASSFVLSTIYDSVYSNSESIYVAVGDSGKIATSSNGTSWTQIFPSSSFGASSIRGVADTEDSLVAVASAGKIGTAIIPVTWAQRASTFELDTINDVYAKKGLAVAVGNAGKIAYSV